MQADPSGRMVKNHMTVILVDGELLKNVETGQISNAYLTRMEGLAFIIGRV